MYVLGSLVVFVVCGGVVSVCVVFPCIVGLICHSFCVLFCASQRRSVFFSLLSVQLYVVLVLLTSFYGASFS